MKAAKKCKREGENGSEGERERERKRVKEREREREASNVEAVEELYFEQEFVGTTTY